VVKGEYMINCWRAGADEDPYTTLSGAFGDPATGPSNFTNYASETIDANLDTLRTSTDFDERYAAVEDIMLELADQVPQIWTGGTATAFYALPNVRNIGGWTIPDAEGNPTIPGQGVLGATCAVERGLDRAVVGREQYVVSDRAGAATASLGPICSTSTAHSALANPGTTTCCNSSGGRHSASSR
jgi:hypothetical protein